MLLSINLIYSSYYGSQSHTFYRYLACDRLYSDCRLGEDLFFAGLLIRPFLLRAVLNRKNIHFDFLSE